MTAFEVNEALTQQIRISSDLVEHRDYLGMSSIGRCARSIAIEYLLGRGHLSDNEHQNSLRGYMIEAKIKELLWHAQILAADPTDGKSHGRELVALFDARFRGHIDGETVDGHLLEIKSMTQEKFEHVAERKQIFFAHYAQVQVYLRYGGFASAYVVCVSAATFDHAIYEIRANPKEQQALEDKARRILAAVDANNIYEVSCQCGKCTDLYQQRRLQHTMR